MNSCLQVEASEPTLTAPLVAVGGAMPAGHPAESQLARFLPRFGLMSKQLKQTSKMIEDSVVEVCRSFQGIASRAKETVSRTAGFLGREREAHSTQPSFERLIENCSATLVKILNTTEEAGEVSRRAIERIQQIDKASQLIGAALLQLGQIARENKMLAMNARIEAAHAGVHGAGFAVVAKEVVSQTERSQKVTAEVTALIKDLRGLADSTMQDLKRTNEQEHQRVERCRQEVNETLRDMQAAHDEMKAELTGMTEASTLLANDIGAAVRGLQFQDRTSQQIAHVIQDLETLHDRLSIGITAPLTGELSSDDGFAGYTTVEERQVAGIAGAEAAAGDVELF
jgi:methyl-accepting chemotaxis protein